MRQHNPCYEQIQISLTAKKDDEDIDNDNLNETLHCTTFLSRQTTWIIALLMTIHLILLSNQFLLQNQRNQTRSHTNNETNNEINNQINNEINTEINNEINNEFNNEFNNDNTPIKQKFFLHIGPKKTGSSTIQCSFQKSRNLMASHTSYRYLGRQAGLTCEHHQPEDLNSVLMTETLEGARHLSHEVLTHLRQGNSPLFSSERLSTIITNINTNDPESIDRLATLATIIDSVKQDGFQVKPIVTYRRFYEWVPSYYAQKITVVKSFQTALHSKTPAECRISMRSWFDQVPNCTGFPDISMDQHPLQNVLHHLHQALQLDDVGIVNMHQMLPEDKEDIFLAFVRQQLPGSSKFLQIYGKTIISKNMNTAESKLTDFYHLAFAVLRMEDISISQKNITKSAYTVAKAFQKKYSKIVTVFGGEEKIPIVCLSKEQQTKLLEKSLRFEQELFPEWFAMEGTEIDHRNGFQKYVDRGKFCEWDVTQMLQNKFFKTIAIFILSQL